MEREPMMQKRDLVLPPGSYAYMQDVTKGVIKTYTGPTVINPTAQEVPVVYNAKAGTFSRANTLEEAVRNAPVAVEGFYINLLNPAKQNAHPNEGSSQPSADLDVGRKVIVPGPAMFALWPGQAAEVVRGHHLRSNQYLLCRVYNEDEARKNWTKAVVKPAAEGTDGTAPNGTATNGTAAAPTATLTMPTDLTIGKLLIIRGTEVSFYIPPTGITVMADKKSAIGQPAVYVRDALTLERLEYCILVDENGKKRYETGPKVVFPTPSERFIESKDDAGAMTRKFRAVELNEIQGLHIKVIAPYTDSTGEHKQGDELFITGKETAIYFPREEHSAIKYDGKAKHFATAVPAGEARYVMNRLTGEIKTVKGPAMLLPDPRTEVIVRRVLTEKQVTTWYPGNVEALEYNNSLRSLLTKSPTTRAGAISEGDYSRGVLASNKSATSGRYGSSALTSNATMDMSQVSQDQYIQGDEFSRGSTFTQPRTVTLDTKYQGAPQIDAWTGFAVQVVSKTGKRRVERGPATILLEYDEILEQLEMSTGRPKNTDVLLRTVYLRVENNKVSDLVPVETIDHVEVDLKLSYKVTFEGDASKWFAVENYVKFLCDHARSVLKGAIRKFKVEEFYATSTDVIRDILLGKSADGKRTGMFFAENGMRLTDVEVLKVELKDERIRKLLADTQHQIVSSNIDLSTARRNLEVLKTKETIAQDEAQAKAATKLRIDELSREQLASEIAVILTKTSNALKEASEKHAVLEAEQANFDVGHAAGLQRDKATREQALAMFAAEQAKKIEMLKAEAEAVVTRFNAAQAGFSEALLALSNNETMVKVAEAWNIQRAIGGDNIADAIGKIFASTPLKGLVEKLVTVNGKAERAVGPN